MYRDMVTVAKSLYRMALLCPAYHLSYILARFSGQMAAMTAETLGVEGFEIRVDDDLMPGIRGNAVVTASYLNMRRRGFDVSAVRYEDLVARPLDMCRIVMEFCHLPVSLAELAVKAFKVDSQRNTVASKSILGGFKDPELTPQKKAKLNEQLIKYGVPLIGEPNMLEGTLTCC